MSDELDDAKKIVLARRARFIAAALAGISIACGKDKAPQPCLEMTSDPDASAAAAPEPCLSAVPTTPPAWSSGSEPPSPSTDTPVDAGSTKQRSTRPGAGRPTACLSVAPPPRTPPSGGGGSKPRGFDYRDDDFGDPK